MSGSLAHIPIVKYNLAGLRDTTSFTITPNKDIQDAAALAGGGKTTKVSGVIGKVIHGKARAYRNIEDQTNTETAGIWLAREETRLALSVSLPLIRRLVIGEGNDPVTGSPLDGGEFPDIEQQIRNIALTQSTLFT
ncbi:hypothetical protein G7Y89_g3336 [Cudoniella acicularis]|uniref:Uncharacterized protein n=1 Tax=Cudoniella acicularis TaxID=354080 RepID=A0A8H4W8H4_9HELO|nr:hypothetical protein G7Y89_g3336 [Cudoniella acicularis]